MRLVLIASSMLVSVTTPALANQCPNAIAALDQMMSQHGSMLSDEKAAQVKELRDQAEQAHEAGNHDESMQAVQQAQAVMGM